MTKGGVKATFLFCVSTAPSKPWTLSASSLADQERQQFTQRISESDEEVAWQ